MPHKPLIRKITGTVWTDEDFATLLIDDYSTNDLPVEAKIMLDLAEKLADARRQWMPKREPSGAESYPSRAPRHTQSPESYRHGRDPGAKRE